MAFVKNKKNNTKNREKVDKNEKGLTFWLQVRIEYQILLQVIICIPLSTLLQQWCSPISMWLIQNASYDNVQWTGLVRSVCNKQIKAPISNMILKDSKMFHSNGPVTNVERWFPILPAGHFKLHPLKRNNHKERSLDVVLRSTTLVHEQEDMKPNLECMWIFTIF